MDTIDSGTTNLAHAWTFWPDNLKYKFKQTIYYNSIYDFGKRDQVYGSLGYTATLAEVTFLENFYWKENNVLEDHNQRNH